MRHFQLIQFNQSLLLRKAHTIQSNYTSVYTSTCMLMQSEVELTLIGDFSCDSLRTNDLGANYLLNI